MIKASGYGAGSKEIAKTLQEHHVDYLAVAVADEGAELRKADITASIIIMDPELTAFKTMGRINRRRRTGHYGSSYSRPLLSFYEYSAMDRTSNCYCYIRHLGGFDRIAT